MRACHKGTQHPYCVYLSAEEAVDLLNEASDAVNQAYRNDEELPALSKLHDKLNAVYGAPKGTRA